MRTHFLKIVTLLILAFGLPASSCFALDWEIERNFRYFVYPSDVAIQRVAADMYAESRGHAASPEDLEIYLNGPGFWTASLATAGGLRNAWPRDWAGSSTGQSVRSTPTFARG
jgi:hypothetical protein